MDMTMPQQLEMLSPAGPVNGALVQGTVVNRSALAKASLRKFAHASVTCMHDSETERVVTEIRLYECSAYLETRKLFDFDTERNRWCTEGEARREEIDDPKQSSRIALAMAARLSELPRRDTAGAIELYSR